MDNESYFVTLWYLIFRKVKTPLLLCMLLLGVYLSPITAICSSGGMASARNTSGSNEMAFPIQEEEPMGRSVEDTITEAYTAKLEFYKKDSLKILIVKLIGIQQLAEKGLLDKDIAENPKYYTSLLTELQKSDMKPEEYQFLSRRMAFLTLADVEQKYSWSKMANLGLILLLFGLTVALFRFKKKGFYPKESLTRQEQNIRQLILMGRSNKEIASELFISPSTVKTHITNIYQKLNISSRTELLRKFKN